MQENRFNIISQLAASVCNFWRLNKARKKKSQSFAKSEQAKHSSRDDEISILYTEFGDYCSWFGLKQASALQASQWTTGPEIFS